MSNDIDNLSDIIPGLSSEIETQFLKFFELVSHYNSKINLVAQSTIPRAGVRHFADSYLGLKCFEEALQSKQNLFDFGSGNGFPGVIAAILYPDKKIVLVERDQRKAEFLRVAKSELSLQNIEIMAHSTADLNDDACEVVISRAMAPLPKFLLEARRVVPPGGVAYLFKGDTWTGEFGACPPQIFDFWDVDVAGTYLLPSNESIERYIVACTRHP